MGKYKIALSDRAKIHLSEWRKSGQLIALRKIERIFIELSNTPFSGIGSPESLKYKFTECWSRQIDKKNRIIYQVNDEVISVFVISAKGHYGDK
ncbi:MAG: Txe/YoeB family addiction module toxin [Bacteroidota bacterium]|nr:Txe/YoeB family addiction module toxin [Bacteroidota bacterium]